MGAGEDNTGSTPMFAIFLLSIFSLLLIPYTLYKLCGGGGEDTEASAAANHRRLPPVAGGALLCLHPPWG